MLVLFWFSARADALFGPERVDRPLWILDGNSTAGNLVFVPAVQK
jgi:hypothetical protein